MRRRSDAGVWSHQGLPRIQWMPLVRVNEAARAVATEKPGSRQHIKALDDLDAYVLALVAAHRNEDL